MHTTEWVHRGQSDYPLGEVISASSHVRPLVFGALLLALFVLKKNGSYLPTAACWQSFCSTKNSNQHKKREAHEGFVTGKGAGLVSVSASPLGTGASSFIAPGYP